jgi:hypothetical protein
MWRMRRSRRPEWEDFIRIDWRRRNDEQALVDELVVVGDGLVTEECRHREKTAVPSELNLKKCNERGGEDIQALLLRKVRVKRI